MARSTWDPKKAAVNAQKHGISFAEASSVLDDPYALLDTQEHRGETRLVVIGYSSLNRVLYVIAAEVDDETIQIVSARRAEKSERRAYEAREPK